MFDKSYSLKTANEILKEVIIPELPEGMGKEQAIALISVLKNIDMWTKDNLEPRKVLIEKINSGMNSIVAKIQNDHPSPGLVKAAESLLQELKGINETNDEMDEKWKKANGIQCELIRLLYKESMSNPNIEELYIKPLRRNIREQLDFEMKFVR